MLVWMVGWHSHSAESLQKAKKRKEHAHGNEHLLYVLVTNHDCRKTKKKERGYKIKKESLKKVNSLLILSLARGHYCI